MIEIRFKKLHPEAQLPKQMTSGSLGLDLFAFLLTDEGRPNTALIPPRTSRAISTGLLIEPPQQLDIVNKEPEWLVQVVSRSGLALNRCLFVANAPGIIDPDYRGELKVILYNGGHDSQYIKHEDRIAQLILVRSEFATPTAVAELSAAPSRGAAGFGSTDKESKK